MDVPREIILGILKLLQKSDLKSARLVSKTWTGFATQLLFDQVYVSPHAENLEVFCAIARHPVLSRCIKTLRYDGVDFVATWNRQIYFRYLWRQTRHYFDYLPQLAKETPSSDPEINTWVKLATDHVGIFNANWSMNVNVNVSFVLVWNQCKDYDFIVKGIEKYRRCSRFQHSQLSNGAFLEKVVAGLQKLSNLSCIILDDQWSDIEVCRQKGSSDSNGFLLRRLTGSPLSRGWNIFHTCPQQWEFSPQPNNIWSEMLSGAADGSGHYSFITVALLRSQRRIQTLIVGDEFCSGVPPYIFDRNRLGHDNLDIAAFSGLTVLELSLASYEGERTPKAFPNIRGLQLLLGSLHGLKVLALRLSDCPKDETVCYSYSQVFPQDGHWNHLTSLSLYSFASSDTDLLTLVTRKMPKLSHLELDIITLLRGTWEGVFECMMRSRHLTKFRFMHGGSQLWHRGAIGLVDFFYEGAPKYHEIEQYVEEGGRHPCLRPLEPDYRAENYITEDLKPFCEVLR